jgi:hypothetical protein
MKIFYNSLASTDVAKNAALHAVLAVKVEMEGVCRPYRIALTS